MKKPPVAGAVSTSQFIPHSTQHSLAQAATGRKNFDTKKFQSIRSFYYYVVSGVERKSELVGEKRFRCGSVPHHIWLFWANDNEIVTVAEVGLGLERLDHKAVELIEINIGKDLTGQIANGDAVARSAKVLSLSLSIWRQPNRGSTGSRKPAGDARPPAGSFQSRCRAARRPPHRELDGAGAISARHDSHGQKIFECQRATPS